jgi:hypothetical protein
MTRDVDGVCTGVLKPIETCRAVGETFGRLTSFRLLSRPELLARYRQDGAHWHHDCRSQPRRVTVSRAGDGDGYLALRLPERNATKIQPAHHRRDDRSSRLVQLHSTSGRNVSEKSSAGKVTGESRTREFCVRRTVTLSKHPTRTAAARFARFFCDRPLASGKVVVPQRHPSPAMTSKDKAEIDVA